MQQQGAKELTEQSAQQPRDDAAANARRRFEGGSARHVAAMARFPASRRFEVAPLQYLLPEGRSCLFDLFAGTGFASESIRCMFGGTFLLEPHVPLVVGESGNSRRQRACALSAESFDGFPEAAMAVCLAGFHHVLGPGPAEDKASHHRQRLNALRLWRSQLTPGGRLVIADVPAMGAEAGWVEGDLHGLTPFADPRSGWANSNGPFPDAFQQDDLGDYLAGMTSRCDELRLDQPEPAAFFDRVVAKQSPYGHVASFDSPMELADLFLDAGFEHVRTFVAPTPWLFPRKTDAVWFVRELLGIGQPCGHPSALGAAELECLEADIRNHLDLRQVSEDVWAVAWKLMYVTGDRP